jgi:hypothetical protein
MNTIRSFFFRLREGGANAPYLLWIDDEEPGVIRYGMKDVATGRKYLVTVQDQTEEEA